VIENQNQPEIQPEPVKEETPASAGAQAITKRGFKPDNPENYAYMLIESPNVDSRTGQILSKPYPATFNEKDWSQFLQYRTSQNLEVREILHLPAGWKKPDIFQFHNK
jgi:hypothetical protein